jgi:hypothetical protein
VTLPLFASQDQSRLLSTRTNATRDAGVWAGRLSFFASPSSRPRRKLTNHGYGAHVLLSGVVESREKGGSGCLLRLTQLR